MAIFDPLQNRHPLTDRQKICHRWLRRRPLQLCHNWCTSINGGFWANGWNITTIIFIYLCPFFREVTYRSDASTDFHAWWLKPYRLAQGCSFLGLVAIAPHFGGKNPYFGGMNRHFQAKLVKSKNMHIKTKASIPTKFCTAVTTTKCPSWVVWTHNKSRWRIATILEKSKNRHIWAVVWPISTKYGTATKFSLLEPSDR